MKTHWDPDQLRLREAFAEVGRGVAERAPANVQAGRFDREGWHDVTRTGLWRLPVSPDDGGLGQGWWAFAAALEGLATTARDFGFLLSVIAHTGAVRIVESCGTPEQKAWLLPRLLDGQVASTATTEPQGGSDVARVRTQARATGNRLLLSGHKAHITNAPIAAIFVILGRIPSLGEKRDLTLFVLERGKASGLSPLAPEMTLGNRTSPTGDIVLTDVPIEPANVLGAPGDGLKLLYGMLALDRLLYALVAGGFTEHMLAASLRFATARRTFNRALADNQLVQDKIVRMKTNMEVARHLAYAALDAMVEGRADAALVCSIAKLVGTEGLWQSAQEFLQLHGHAGYMEGPVAQVFKDVVAARIAGGTSEMQKLNVFKQLDRLYARGGTDEHPSGAAGQRDVRGPGQRPGHALGQRNDRSGFTGVDRPA